MKIFKRAISALLASVMCIPSGLLSLSYATETSSDGSFTVTLTEGDGNGTMQFSEECMEASTATQDGYHMMTVNENGELEEVDNDGSVWAFSKGDIVEIELIPNSGYQVSSFSIKNPTTGNLMAHEDTTNNVFSFVMPGKSVTVEAAFDALDNVESEIKELELDSDEDKDDSEEDPVVDEETNIIDENEYGETIYRRIELVDDKAISLQKRIYNIPAVTDIYADFYSGENNYAEELEIEVNEISDIYFNEISDVQRAQIDSAPLFAALLVLNAGDGVISNDQTMDEDSLSEIQDRINNLASVDEVADVVEENEHGLVYEYINEEQDMLVTNETQDELFLEVLDLSQTVYSLDQETMSGLDVSPLDEMFNFFTMGSVMASNDGIMTLAATNENVLEGPQDHQFIEEYNASVFVGGLKEWNGIVPMYCGDTNLAALTHSGSTAMLKDIQKLEPGTPIAGATSLEPNTIEIVRAVLYYGYGGPGQAEGVDVYTKSSLPSGVDSKIKVNGLELVGTEIQKYMVTHFALSYAYSGHVGLGPSTVGTDYLNFYEFCKNNKDKVPEWSTFETYICIPKGRYQPYFFAKLNEIGSFERRDPFNIYLMKLSNQMGYEYTGSTLAGAEYTITYYKAEEDAMGNTDERTLVKGYKDAVSTGKDPTATFTFETKDLIKNGQPTPFATAGILKDLANDIFNSYNGIDKLSPDKINIAGISTMPTSLDADYWTNAFLTSSPDDYNKYYGGSGSYLIRETRAPQGFDLSGTISIAGTNPYMKSTDVQKGVVITISYIDNGRKAKYQYYDQDGNSSELPTQAAIITTNPITGQEFKVGDAKVEGKNGGPSGAVIVSEEKPATMRLWSEALCVDTGTQYADPNTSNLYVQDTIHIQTYPELEANYKVYTMVIDLNSKKVIPFNNDKNIMGGELGNYKPSDGIYSSYDIRYTDDFDNLGGKNTTIFHEFNSKEDVEPGQTYTYTVRGSLNCDVNSLIKQGHTLIFFNMVEVYNAAPDGGQETAGASDELIYFYPTSRTDTSDEVPKEEGDKRRTLYETAISDSKEMIYLSTSSTDIISTQTKRKHGDGESIIYAGMYTDGTFTSGGGAIKQTLVDTVNYHNLQRNKTYYVKGYLIDRDTGTLACDANGTPIQNTDNTIKQQSSSSTCSTGHNGDNGACGSWKIEYSFDATNCGNRVYVSYVEVYLDDELVAEFKPTDKNSKEYKKESFYIPEITTKLWDDSTGVDITYAEEMVKVHDTITYRKLMPGAAYKVETRLVNMETGETLLDVNGNPVIREKILEGADEVTFEDGEIDIEVEFPAVIRDEKGDIVKSLAGTIFVAYEKIYIEQGAVNDKGEITDTQGHSGKWVLVADHEDFWDKNQRIYMPYIDTTALDQKTDEHISYAEKNMKIYDTVHYEAIRPEYTYRLVSELRDATTGEIVVDNAGKKQVITSYFKADFDLQDNQYLTYGDVIPENHEGSGITFDVDAEFFAGRTLVIFERLYLDNEYGSREHLIAEHQVLLDEEQTIHVPKVWTSAIDSDTFTKTSLADGSTTIIDTFSYDNLIPGFTYELKGYVLDKNQTVINGTNMIAVGTDGKLAQNSLVFTPESSSGAVRLAFEVNTSKFGTEDYNGMVFVVYEELYVIQRYDGDDDRSIVASHTDIADLNQTIYVPRITTSLNDKKTGTKIMLAEKDAHLVDRIDYYRFQPNTEYVIKGKLLDMSTGAVLTDSKDNRVEKTVEVMSSDTGTGSWTVDYEFDATELQGKVVVAYADVYVRNGERNDILSHVASHNDFWNDEQRVFIPLISTVATDQKTNSHVTYAEENVWVTDRISYSHLKPDTEYKLISKLIDKDSGEVVVDDKGIAQVIESTFTTTPNESQKGIIRLPKGRAYAVNYVKAGKFSKKL
ncbi:MAG: VaFE repeat-containing surface-anchored protein [Lachnospiraceae bacterium]|nr:VaFE repeat-containing surface-anchored protein [Lachnospiraceae bacterium]